MTQVKVIESELIHNLQFEIMYNGLTYSVQNETAEFATGRHYSPSELAQGNNLACQGIMLEANRLYSCNTGGYVNALIADSQYSKQGFENNLQKINWCAWWEPSNAFHIFVKDSDLEKLLLFVPTEEQALKLSKHYAKVHNLPEEKAGVLKSGKMLDHVSNHTLEARTRKAASVLMCKTMKRELFTLQDEAPNLLFTDSDFFKWLDDNKVTDHNTIRTRDQYLKSIGFNVAIHKLSTKAISVLLSVLQHHFDQRIKPTLQGAK